MIGICMPYIHSTAKLGEVAGARKSKGDTSLLNFAKFDTAHRWCSWSLSQRSDPSLWCLTVPEGFAIFQDGP